MSKLTLEDRLFIRSFWSMADEFMRDPEHRAGFEEWKARRAGAPTATNETRATPPKRPQPGTMATV